ncbi:MAG TPA: sigma-70 family RNA polymerase sigma factor [Anaerolineales bacterium]|nr:sigma-70 family RNA polymerase sigma factor [Anaerolineales bacterium]
MATHPLEKTMIEQAQAGDLDAFNQLVLHYQDGLYHYAVSLVNDPDLAEDITQESLIKAFQNIKNLQGYSFRAWLFRIITNTARDLARRSARHPLVSLYPKDDNGEEVESPEWMIDPTSNVEEIVQGNEFSAQLYELLEELPEAYRNILILVDVQEMDYIEAAEILNIPLGTVKSRLARARMQMKSKLQIMDKSRVFARGARALAV